MDLFAINEAELLNMKIHVFSSVYINTQELCQSRQYPDWTDSKYSLL